MVIVSEFSFVFIVESEINFFPFVDECKYEVSSKLSVVILFESDFSLWYIPIDDIFNSELIFSIRGSSLLGIFVDSVDASE